MTAGIPLKNESLGTLHTLVEIECLAIGILVVSSSPGTVSLRKGVTGIAGGTGSRFVVECAAERVDLRANSFLEEVPT